MMEPVELVTKYKPRRVSDLVGMASVKRRLAKLIQHPYTSAWLLTGPSGLGKTTAAFAVAAEIGAQIHHMPSRQCDLASVSKALTACHYAPMFAASKWHAAIVDEADQMSHPAQLAFLSALDGTATPENTLFFFTANDTKNLEPRFISRCRQLRFSIDDAEEEVHRFLARVWEKESGKPEDAPCFARLFRNSEFNIRTALNNLEMELSDPGGIMDIDRTQPATVVSIATGRSVDRTRSEAARRAWITIRAKRAAKDRKRA
jgi:replication-associated recombination protein RarA